MGLGGRVVEADMIAMQGARYLHRVRSIFAACLVCISISPSVSMADEQAMIDKATKATVLIKTHLKHGFIEDKEANDRWRGSGFVVDRDEGLIMTNAHVAGYGVSMVRVQFEGQKKFTDAKKVFLDGKHDVALIKISPDEVPAGISALAFDCDYSLSRGNRVFSLGHPEGQDFTVSFGVLSGAKDFHVDGNYFTTDLVVEPGSSGGPVVLAETGDVIGMTTAGFDESDIGFITKSSDICPILNLVREGINPARPRFGFQTMVVDKELSPTVGAVFDNTLPVKTGDEILSWNGNLWSPKEHGDLGDAMRGYGEDTVQLTLVRDGQETSLSVPVTVGRSIHDQEWVYFTGLTITEDVKADARYVMGNTSAPLLHIETIDTDFNDTDDVEFYRGVDIASVGGVAGMDLRTLYQMLSEWPEGSEIRVVARVFDRTPESYSHQMSHSFTIKDLNCSWCPEKP